MAVGFPDIVFNSPQDRPALRRVFNFEAPYYDLAAYEKIKPGFGVRIWGLIEAERALQETRAKHPQFNPKNYGYTL